MKRLQQLPGEESAVAWTSMEVAKREGRGQPDTFAEMRICSESEMEEGAGLGEGAGWTSGMKVLRMLKRMLLWAGTQALSLMASRGPPRPGFLHTGESGKTWTALGPVWITDQPRVPNLL